MIANLRNSTFSNSKFTKLLFLTQPSKKEDVSEGFLLKSRMISFPIIYTDTDNSYNNNIISVKYTDPHKFRYSEHNKKLYKSYRKYYKHNTYTSANVYLPSSNTHLYNPAPQIYSVTFKSSLLDSTTVKEISIDTTIFIDTVVNNTLFNSVLFVNSSTKKTLFTNCTFVNCSFVNMKIKSTNFIDCKISDSFFDSCMLDIKFISTNLNNVSFTWCNVIQPLFDKCTLLEVSSSYCTNNYGYLYNLE